MRIFCTKCGFVFESLILDNDLAWKEIEKDSIEHVKKNHSNIIPLLGKALAIATTNLGMLMHAQEFLIIPECEPFVLDKMQKASETVLLAVGIDVDDVEEEEEEESGEEVTEEVAEPANEPSDSSNVVEIAKK